MMKKLGLMLCMLFVFSLPAYALSISEAKAQGLVGEQVDGYLGIVSQNVTGTNQDAVTHLVTQINQQRKDEYQQIANNNGTSVSQVQTVAGRTLIDLAKQGQYVKTAQGVWVKK